MFQIAPSLSFVFYIVQYFSNLGHIYFNFSITSYRNDEINKY